MKKWSLNSWTEFPAKHLPVYQDKKELELVLSKKNTTRLLKEGAVERYQFHYKFIVAFHFFFVVFFFVKSFFNSVVNIEYLYVFFIVQILRYKIIYDLGKFWTTRILVINKPLIKTFAFRYFRHPNYIIVC